MRYGTFFCLGVMTAAIAGCSGEYILTVPDQIAPRGGQATAVARLTRNEFAGYKASMKEAAIRFQFESDPVRGAYTDQKGYAAAVYDVGNRLGTYHVNVAHLDNRGGEISVYAPAYVWDNQARVTVVDLDALLEPQAPADAVAAINRVASDSYIVYFTRLDIKEHAWTHVRMKNLGLPDGPVVTWQQGSYSIFGSVDFLRSQFPHLESGICVSEAAASSFARAGLKVTAVGPQKIAVSGVTRLVSWSQVAPTKIR